MANKAVWEGWMATRGSVSELFKWDEGDETLIQGSYVIVKDPATIAVPVKQVRVMVERVQERPE